MRLVPSLIAFACIGLLSTTSDAHVGINSGPAQANSNNKITFSVGHGCEGLDTSRVRILIPTGISSVRALPSAFGKVSVERNVAGDATTAVVWDRPVEDLLDGDYNYYEVTIRARVADVPFTKIAFTVEQTCLDAEGDPVLVTWTGDTAANLTVVPQRRAGWNRFVLTTGILAADFAAYLADALIVWKGNAAYSSNANTAAAIAATAGVTTLSSDLAAADEIWVKY